MFTKNINGIWVHQNTGLYYQVVAVQPPCEQQQLVKLCYKKYEGHLGKLKCIAFLPSGPQTMNNLHYKIIDSKKLKKTAPSPCSPTDRPLITEVWRKMPLPYIVQALADVALLRSSKRLP